MEIKHAYRVNFKSKNDDRGDYQIIVSASSSDKALAKVTRYIDAHKDELEGVIEEYYVTSADLLALMDRLMADDTMDEKQQSRYYFDHCPTVESFGFMIG